MPPKKAISKDDKKKIDDKTFGMKNKKSGKAAKFMQTLQVQAETKRSAKDADSVKEITAAKNKLAAEKKAALDEIFTPVLAIQKVAFGVDPKTVLCVNFKANICPKGTKCRFSHDLEIGRKEVKINIYTDARGEQEKDTMDTWSMDKLESVIARKNAESKTIPTDIVCKFFIESIEDNKYGWFWICPNGGDACKYKHCLPIGYILKKKESEEERKNREEEEKENQITIEDFLETERHNLGPNLTPITFESFIKWKVGRKSKQQTDAERSAQKKADAYKLMKAGSKVGMTFSGRELFDFNPDWAATGDAEEDGVMEEYVREDSDVEELPIVVENLSIFEDNIEQASPSDIEDQALYEDLEGLDDDDSEEEEKDVEMN